MKMYYQAYADIGTGQQVTAQVKPIANKEQAIEETKKAFKHLKPKKIIVYEVQRVVVEEIEV